MAKKKIRATRRAKGISMWQLIKLCPLHKSSLSEIDIKVFDSTIIYVPNAFTPNNDRLNDRFHVIVQGRVKSFHISVYNRFGNVVYSGNDINGSWDGTLRGAPSPSGVYVYVITALTYENKSISQKGIITLIR